MEENTKGMVVVPFDKEINVGVNHGFNQPSQQKLRIEMGLYQQKHCQLGLKETEKTRQNEGKLIRSYRTRP